MTTCKDCYRRNPATGYCPVRTYEVEEDHEPCGSYATPPRDMNEPKEEATKVCKRCGKELPLSSFSRNRNGLLGVCKDCMKAAQKKGAKPAKPAKPEKPAEPEAPKEELAHEPEPEKADPAPDYEKKYKDALDWMKTIYRFFGEDLRESVDHFFPELPELCPDVIPTTLLTGSGGISYPSVLYAVESWKDEQVRFFLKDVVRILRDRGYQINAEIVVTEKL